MSEIVTKYKEPKVYMKLLGFICLVLSAYFFISGYLFISDFEIGTANDFLGRKSIAVIDTGLLQIAGIKYLTSALFALIATVLFIGRALLFKE